MKESVSSHVLDFSLMEQHAPLGLDQILGLMSFNPANHKIDFINKTAAELLGLKTNHKPKINHIFSKQNDFEKLISILNSQGKACGFEFLSRPINDGNTRWLSIDCLSHKNRVGCVIKDITDRKYKDADHERLKILLEKFIYHSSHTLRAPISTLLGLIHLMEVDGEGKYINLIKSQVLNLDEILGEIATLAYNNNSDLLYRSVTIKSEIDLIVRLLSYINTSISFKVSVDEVEKFNTDAIRLNLVLKNLIRFIINNTSEEEGVKQVVRISFTKNQGIGVLSIGSDTLRMPSESIEHIFEVFTKNMKTNTSLGLYVIRQVVEKLNGKIGVFTSLNGGTEFIIRVPEGMLKREKHSVRTTINSLTGINSQAARGFNFDGQ